MLLLEGMILREPFDPVALEAVLSSARSKAKSRQVWNFQGKLKTEREGIAGSVSKQGTLRSQCFRFHGEFMWRLRVRLDIPVEVNSAVAVRAVAEVLISC